MPASARPPQNMCNIRPISHASTWLSAVSCPNGQVRCSAPRQPAGVGVSTFVADSVPARATTCTPAARRGGSLNPAHASDEMPPHSGAPRQPAGVGVSTVSIPRSSGWTCRCTPAARRGGSLNVVRGPRSLNPSSCTPAARRGGSLNNRRASRWRKNARCTPAARRGGSLNVIMCGRMRPSLRCTPAARRGGSLNRLPLPRRLLIGRAPRQPAGVGVSTPPCTAG